MNITLAPNSHWSDVVNAITELPKDSVLKYKIFEIGSANAASAAMEREKTVQCSKIIALLTEGRNGPRNWMHLDLAAGWEICALQSIDLSDIIVPSYKLAGSMRLSQVMLKRLQLVRVRVMLSTFAQTNAELGRYRQIDKLTLSDSWSPVHGVYLDDMRETVSRYASVADHEQLESVLRSLKAERKADGTELVMNTGCSELLGKLSHVEVPGRLDGTESF